MKRLVSLLVLLPLLAAAEPVRSGKAEAELVSNLVEVRPGGALTLAVRLKADPGWHSYWINPGFAGQATQVAWDLPPGFRAGILEYPVPSRFKAGDFTGFGYKGEILLLTNITAPKGLKTEEVTFKATVSWLTCDDSQCLPGKAELELTLPVLDQQPAPTKWAAPIGRALRTVPRFEPAANAGIRQEGEDWVITVQLPEDKLGFPSAPQFFPETPDFAGLEAKPVIKDIEGGFQVRVPVAESAEEMKNPIRFVVAGLKKPLRFSATAPVPLLPKDE